MPERPTGRYVADAVITQPDRSAFIPQPASDSSNSKKTNVFILVRVFFFPAKTEHVVEVVLTT